MIDVLANNFHEDEFTDKINFLSIVKENPTDMCDECALISIN